jgi:hypothetical protein
MSFFNGDILASSSDGIVLKDLGTVATTPSSGYGTIYVNGDALYFKSDGGTATDLTSVGFGNKTIILSNPSTSSESPTDIAYNSLLVFDLNNGQSDYTSYYINLTGTPSDLFVCRIFLKTTSGNNQFLSLYVSGASYGSSNLDVQYDINISEGFYKTFIYNPNSEVPSSSERKWYVEG